MGLDIYIECLGLELAVRWVVHARNSLGACQVVQIGGKLVELCPRSLFLQLGLLQRRLS